MSKKELIELADKLQELYLVAEGDSEVCWKDWQADATDIRKRIYYEKTSGTAMGLLRPIDIRWPSFVRSTQTR